MNIEEATKLVNVFRHLHYREDMFSKSPENVDGCLWDGQNKQFIFGMCPCWYIYLTLHYGDGVKVRLHSTHPNAHYKCFLFETLDIDHWHHNDLMRTVYYRNDKTDVVAQFDLKIKSDELLEKRHQIEENLQRWMDDWSGLMQHHSQKINTDFMLWALKRNYETKSELQNFDWNEVSSSDWAEILIARCDLDCHCRWNLSDDAWAQLLPARPELIDKCDWDRFGERDSSAVSRLLKAMPSCAVKANLTCVTAREWVELITQHHELMRLCDWSKLSYRDMKALSDNGVEFVDDCNWGEVKFTGKDLASFILDAPSWKSRYLTERTIDKDCVAALTEDAIHNALLEGWQLRDGDVWAIVLCMGKKNDELCKWKMLEHYNWREVLKVRPELIHQVPPDLMTEGDWTGILIKQPSLVKYCECAITDEHLREILHQSGLLEEIDKKGVV